MPLKVKARSENYFGPIGCLTHQCTRALARLDIMGQTNPYKIFYSSCKWVWSPLVISWNKKWPLDKSYNHKSKIYWYVTVVICKLYPLISNSSSLKDFFFTSIRALSFASCGRLIIGDITSKDESFSIHALPHMFHTTSFAYSLWLHLLPFSITQLASSCITSSIVFYDFGSQKFPHTSYNKFPRNNHSSRTWNTGKFVSKILVEFNWWNIDFAEIWERNFNQKKKLCFVLWYNTLGEECEIKQNNPYLF